MALAALKGSVSASTEIKEGRLLNGRVEESALKEWVKSL